MHIELKRLDEAFHFEAINEDGNVVLMDGSPSIGGGGQGARPMQLLLMGLGGCSGIDVVHILKKQRQEITSLKMGIDGEREPNVEPSLFRDITVNFLFEGPMDATKVRRAVELSMEKYCSVAMTLAHTADINYTIQLNGEII